MVNRSDFTPAAPGSLVDIGGGFVAFVPDALPPDMEWTGSVVQALSSADRAIGELAGGFTVLLTVLLRERSL